MPAAFIVTIVLRASSAVLQLTVPNGMLPSVSHHFRLMLLPSITFFQVVIDSTLFLIEVLLMSVSLTPAGTVMCMVFLTINFPMWNVVLQSVTIAVNRFPAEVYPLRFLQSCFVISKCLILSNACFHLKMVLNMQVSISFVQFRLSNCSISLQQE